MSEALLVIVAVASILTTVASVFVNRRMRAVEEKVETVHFQINSRMSQLMETYGLSERAAGAAQERADQEARRRG